MCDLMCRLHHLSLGVEAFLILKTQTTPSNINSGMYVCVCMCVCTVCLMYIRMFVCLLAGVLVAYYWQLRILLSL